MNAPAFSPAAVNALLNRIAEVMGASPQEHAKFQRWAEQTLRQTTAAGKAGAAAWAWQLGVLRQEYAELQRDIAAGIAVTGRTELQRTCRREWLAHVLGWLEDTGVAAEPTRLAA